jgi:hypothetical protein
MIFDDHGLTKVPGQLLGNDSSRVVGSTSGGVGNDHSDRTVRVILRRRMQLKTEQGHDGEEFWQIFHDDSFNKFEMKIESSND